MKAQLFRKLPVVIEAINYDGTMLCANKIIEWCGNNSIQLHSAFLEISTLEGTMLVSKGDWVIKGVNGEFYPCKPDIFGKTYEPIIGL